MHADHREYEPFELAENMEEDLGMFEAATRARRVALGKPALKNVLTVLDGSNQDATTEAVANALASHFGASQEIRSDLRTAAAIREAAEETAAGMLVVPVPFGEDIGVLQTESLGSVIDSLLRGAHLPMLCVREPMPAEKSRTLLKNVLFPLVTDHTESAEALAWACSLVTADGILLLLKLPDQQIREAARKSDAGLELSPEAQHASVGRELATRLGALVSAAQHSATESGFAVRTEFRSHNAPYEVRMMANDLDRPLVVVKRPADPTSAQFHWVTDLLREMSTPLLIL